MSNVPALPTTIDITTAITRNIHIEISIETSYTLRIHFWWTLDWRSSSLFTGSVYIDDTFNLFLLVTTILRWCDSRISLSKVPALPIMIAKTTAITRNDHVGISIILDLHHTLRWCLYFNEKEYKFRAKLSDNHNFHEFLAYLI